MRFVIPYAEVIKHLDVLLNAIIGNSLSGQNVETLRLRKDARSEYDLTFEIYRRNSIQAAFQPTPYQYDLKIKEAEQRIRTSQQPRQTPVKPSPTDQQPRRSGGVGPESVPKRPEEVKRNSKRKNSHSLGSKRSSMPLQENSDRNLHPKNERLSRNSAPLKPAPQDPHLRLSPSAISKYEDAKSKYRSGTSKLEKWWHGDHRDLNDKRVRKEGRQLAYNALHVCRQYEQALASKYGPDWSTKYVLKRDVPGDCKLAEQDINNIFQHGEHSELCCTERLS